MKKPEGKARLASRSAPPSEPATPRTSGTAPARANASKRATAGSGPAAAKPAKRTKTGASSAVPPRRGAAAPVRKGSASTTRDALAAPATRQRAVATAAPSAPGRGRAAEAAEARPGRARRSIGGTAHLPRPVRRMSKREIDALFERLSEANPAPTTELEFSTPYELLVAVALSAQATDVSVNKATRHLFPVANTPQAMAKLGVEGLAPYIATINFNRTKARNVIAMAGQLLERHGGEVPLDRESLEALAGVGRKTANVILNTAFGESTLAVDTHIFRVSNRTGLAPGRDVRHVEDELVKVVPGRFLRHAHHWLLLHGRYVCKARVPDCPRCIVHDLCHYPDKTPGAPPPLEVAPSRTRGKSPR